AGGDRLDELAARRHAKLRGGQENGEKDDESIGERRDRVNRDTVSILPRESPGSTQLISRRGEWRGRQPIRIAVTQVGQLIRLFSHAANFNPADRRADLSDRLARRFDAGWLARRLAAARPSLSG